MRKLVSRSILSCALAAAASASAQSAPTGGLVAQIVIYDVAPESQQQFEQALESTKTLYENEPGFINERVLGSLDNLALKYATYAKFTNFSTAEAALRRRLDAVMPHVRRTPETHLATLAEVFTPAAITGNPKGKEFGQGKVGQIAHLGLFIPFPRFWGQYEKSLHDVKVVTRARKPKGYLGDDILVELSVASPDGQTPFSPRAAEAAKMSINYGEYNTLEDAENSYIQRTGGTPDPQIAALARIFYGSLQVPTRFFIFRVIGNYGPAARR